MVYYSTITFTLDTICPWTYLAFTRLQKAIQQFKNTDAASQIKTTLKIRPYQLYPDFPSASTKSKREWYTGSYFKGDEEKTRKYEVVMTHLFAEEGNLEKFNFDGEVSNTLHAHRVLQYIQTKYDDDDDDAAIKVLQSLYRQYFCEAKAPAAPETLRAALTEAGLGDDQAAMKVVDDEDMGLDEVKEALREAKGDGVDSVPIVSFEGRRRDIELIGAKEVAEYVKALGQIAKESR